VKAEATAANKAGTIDASNTAGSKVEKPVKSDKSRADVKKDTAAANKGGKLDNPDADGSGKVAKPVKSDKSRAEVKAETRRREQEGRDREEPRSAEELIPDTRQ
jgi:hypothetical protein